MDEHLQKMMESVLDRLRETEAQTREQSILLQAHNERIENYSKVTDKFLEHLAKREERDEKRERTMLQAITILVGAVIALALGPKAASTIISKFVSNGQTQVIDSIPWHGDNDRRYCVWGYVRNDEDKT